MFLGVDGARAGWFFVSISADESWETGLMPDARGLWDSFSDAKLILMDIPMGLPFSDSGRVCDRTARSLLGSGRGASIFAVPAREAVYAENYRQACRINQKICGRMISCQSWNICPKIRDVDRLLRRETAAGGIIYESHPELCFLALSGNNPMIHSKKTREGIHERMRVLVKRFKRSGEIYDSAVAGYRRKDVSRDDIVDAIALAVTGFLYAGRLRSLPENPPEDLCGIPMGIVMPPASI